MGSEVIGKVCQETINHGYAIVTVASTIFVAIFFRGDEGLFICQTKLDNKLDECVHNLRLTCIASMT